MLKERKGISTFAPAQLLGLSLPGLLARWHNTGALEHCLLARSALP
ncbi:MAG TPA: hypothetical protein VFN35_20515 [Ktedonobacteraceae bacterium]|nr:hypothetical protein [Ktedonobacteraceae bacterium]